MKAFISHATADRGVALAAREALVQSGVDCFLAHEDLRVSQQWKTRILEELGVCDIFVPIVSRAFRRSNWCGQELGAAVQRDSVLIVPVSVDGTVPYGFISDLQAHPVVDGEIAASVIRDAVATRWPSVVIDSLIEALDNAHSFRVAEALLAPLQPYFAQLTRRQASDIADKAIENAQIWNAQLCRTVYLPEFLQLNKRRLESEKRKALQFQIEHQSWYASRGL